MFLLVSGSNGWGSPTGIHRTQSLRRLHTNARRLTAHLHCILRNCLPLEIGLYLACRPGLRTHSAMMKPTAPCSVTVNSFTKPPTNASVASGFGAWFSCTNCANPRSTQFPHRRCSMRHIRPLGHYFRSAILNALMESTQRVRLVVVLTRLTTEHLTENSTRLRVLAQGMAHYSCLQAFVGCPRGVPCLSKLQWRRVTS